MNSSDGEVTDPEKIKTLTAYYEFDKEIRGSYLIQANWIEDFTEQIISKIHRS